MLSAQLKILRSHCCTMSWSANQKQWHNDWYQSTWHNDWHNDWHNAGHVGSDKNRPWEGVQEIRLVPSVSWQHCVEVPQPQPEPQPHAQSPVQEPANILLVLTTL